MKVLSYIKKILKLELSIDKRPVLIELVCSFVETGEKLLRVLLPAVIIQMVTEKSINVVGIVAVSIILLISLLGLISKVFRSLLTPYALRMETLIGATLRSKLMRLDFEYSEDEEQLDKYNLVKSTFYEFLDVDYLIFNDLLGAVITFTAMSLIFSQINLFIYVLITIISIIVYLLGEKSAVKVHGMESEKKRLYSKREYFKELIYDIDKAKEIKIYSADKYVASKFLEVTDKIKEKDADMEKYRCKIAVLREFIAFIQTVSIYINAIIEFSVGALKLGGFYIYVSAGREFVESVVEIINTITKIKESSMYFKDFDEYLTLKENMYSDEKAKYHIDVINSIEFKDVSFKYKNVEKYALENVNCKIDGNEKVALVGDNGAGKTTFIKLLLRLYDPSSGEILVNGINVKEYYYQEYLAAISSAFQDTRLTGYSLLENIILDREKDNNRLKKVCEVSGIADRVKSLENGFDSIVSKDLSEHGVKFSGGEEQKIAIARAIYNNQNTIVLDEPTSAMDPFAEKNLFKKMNLSYVDSIIIYITHRLSNVVFCDNILVFKDGKIVESGNHKELIESCGEYKKMFVQQANFYLENKKE